MSSSLLKSIVLASALVVLLSCGSGPGKVRKFLDNIRPDNSLETDSGYFENSQEFCLQRVNVKEAGKADEERLEVSNKRCPSNKQLSEESSVIGSVKLTASGTEVLFLVADDNAAQKYGKISRQSDGLFTLVALCAYGSDAERSAVYNNCWVETHTDGRPKTFHRTRQ